MTTTPSSPHPKDKSHLKVVDKRRVGREENPVEAAEPSLKPSYVEELEAKVKAAETRLKARLAELEEEARRSRERVAADLEKRSADREKAILLDVLGILDDLDRASAFVSEAPAVKQGLDLVASRLQAFLAKHGCTKLSPAGQPFDPNTMEALNLLPGPKDEVVAVYAPAIFRGEELLRPARVAVGSGDVPQE